MSDVDTPETDDPTATAAAEKQPGDRAGTQPVDSVGVAVEAVADSDDGRPVSASERVASDRTDDTPVVHVVGMWRRLLAGVVDVVVLLPVLAAGTWLIARVVGISLQTTELRFETLLELLLKGGAGFYGIVAMAAALSMLYTFVFVATTGRTLGLQLLRGRVINVYGERPEWWRAFLRCWAFVIGVLLLGLGLVWIGFDRHKRGLHDWLAGTYVIRQGV